MLCASANTVGDKTLESYMKRKSPASGRGSPASE